MNDRIFSARFSACFLAAAVVTATLCTPQTAVSQNAAAAPAPSRLAVIDIKYILENHVNFKQNMNRLKQQFEAIGKQLNEDRNRIVTSEKQLLDLNPGSADYNQLDEQITRAKADWTVKANKHKKEIRNSESKILWDVYYEIKTETKRYCEQNRIGLVIQFNGDPIKSQQPQDVVKGISRPIVHYDQGLDITPWILQALNKGATPLVGERRGRPATAVTSSADPSISACATESQAASRREAKMSANFDRPSGNDATHIPLGDSVRIDQCRQQTIAEATAVEGFGYWSGKDVRVEFRPAAPDTGIVFSRRDLPTPIRIPAHISFRIETPRRTTLGRDGATVEMVEHIMAALAGLRIDNCEVWADQPEMPGCDGSSARFIEALDAAGVVSQDATRPVLVVQEVTRLGDSDRWIEAQPANDGRLTLRYRLDYSDSSTAIGRQTAEFAATPEVFREQLASARTFMLEDEANWLLAQGFGTRVKPSDVLVFNDEGPIENEVRFADECVRHKILDLVGDLALTGYPIVGKIIAHRTGHRLNAELVKALLKENQVVEAHRKCA